MATDPMEAAQARHAAVRVAVAVIVNVTAYASTAYAQIRPVPPIEPPVIGPPIVIPPIEPPIIRPPVPPVLPPIVTPDVRIVTDDAIIVGTVGWATAELPAAVGTATARAASPAATYRWTVLGGRLLSDPADATAEFTMTTAGVVTLGLTLTVDGSTYITSARVAALPPNAAGAITVATPVSSGTQSLRACVPPAVDNDRTFKWSISGDGRITGGQGGPEIAFAPGSPGVREITCAVTLRNQGTVTLRSFVVVTGTGANVAVDIEQGSGGGTYPAGSVVEILADPPATGTVFERWTGNTEALGGDELAVLLPHGRVTVPAGPMTLTATYRPSPSWTPSMMRAVSSAGPESPCLYHLFPDMRALVLLLHDAGGEAGDWFDRPDQLLLARDLVAAGYGVAAVTSAARNWSNQASLTTNPDARRIVAVLDRLTSENGLPAGLPVHLLGLGGGAQAAPRLAELLVEAGLARPILGVVLLCDTGAEEFAALSRVPALFAVAARDRSRAAADTATARANTALLAGRGVASGWFETGMTALPARRLLKLAAVNPSFSPVEATDVWNVLRAADVIDEHGYVKMVLSADGVGAVLPASLDRFAPAVAEQLQIAAAGRGVFSESAARIRDFLEQRTTALSAPPPGRIVNLSVRSRVAFVSDTFALGFTLSGSERTSVLVRAVGPGLGRFGVATRCLATRLEVYRAGTLVAANEGWDAARNAAAAIAAASTAVGAFPLVPGALDSAVLLALDPGSYQVLVKGVNGTTGDVLLEAYDVTRNATRFGTFAATGRIDDAQTDAMIAGFVVDGRAPRTLLCRTLGPGLTQPGRAANAVLADPRMAVMDSTGAVLTANDNWRDGNADLLRVLATRARLSALTPDSNDAALVSAFPPGSFTLEATAATSSDGALLVELSEVP